MGVAVKVIDFIKRHRLISTGDKLVVAVSGGADSVCLIHVMAQQREKLGVELHIAHLNHKLRGDESDADAAYVTGLAHQLGLPITLEQKDVAAYRKNKKLSIEEAAREVRYRFLANVKEETGASKVVVGHTRNDHVETILIHLLRGTGLNGLSGLKPRSVLNFGKRGKPVEIVRPLLEIYHQETLDYCHSHNLDPCFDSSNQSLSLLRNRIRLELLPILRDFNPAFDDALLRLANTVQADVSFLEEQAFRLWNNLAVVEKEVVYLDVVKMIELPLALQRQIMRKAITQLQGSLEDIEADHIESMVGFLSRPSGKRLSLPLGLTLSMEYGRIVLAAKGASTCPLPPMKGDFTVEVPGETLLPGWRISATVIDGASEETNGDFVALFDLDKTGRQLTVRNRKLGDRFQPLGMAQTKKLQDFMVDARIPKSWRSHVPVVCSPEHILWVVGWRIDDRAKVTSKTRQILKLEFHRAQ
jgi:tRNA(Ile)-lysidine synthase